MWYYPKGIATLPYLNIPSLTFCGTNMPGVSSTNICLTYLVHARTYGCNTIEERQYGRTSGSVPLGNEVYVTLKCMLL